MVIYKKIEEIKEKFDICDSIICGIRWDENMLNLLIIVDYYVGPNADEKTYVIRLKDCFEAKFKMTEWMQKTPADERHKYIWSWHSAFYMEIEKNETTEIKIVTGLDNVWLEAKCEEIWIEDDEILKNATLSNNN